VSNESFPPDRSAETTQLSSSDVHFRKPDLLRFGEQVLGALNVRAPVAEAVALSLVEADSRGVPTHGLVRLPSYVRQVQTGEVRPEAEPRVLGDRGAAVHVDGANAFGAVTANFSLDLALERSGVHGVGVVSARRCAHFGAAALYPLRAARRGFVALVASNTPAVMAPYGGRHAAIGNNPLAIAAPMPDGREPFVLDFAQSVVARGHVKLAEMRGESIPSGWALGPDGEPTTDPAVALSGALLPFGGYKGYGLALAVEVLTSVLAGADLSPDLLNTSMTGAPANRPGARVGSVGQLFVVLDPSAFAGRDGFLSGMDRLVAAMKSVPPASGFSEVLLPGEPELRAAEFAARRGIPLTQSTLKLLSDLAQSLSLTFPEAIET
jgi:LDH2 family malate/lactate/ureidoglycolate dehydrogenase